MPRMLRGARFARQGWKRSIGGRWRRTVARGRRRLQGLAFGGLYGPGAPVYDRFTAWLFLGEWERWQRSILPLLPDRGVVVELGAGTGTLARAAESIRPGVAWICLERSEAMVRVARRNLGDRGVAIVRADARRAPIGAGRAAAVVATFPTEFVLDPEAVAEVARMLQDDGLLVVVLTGRLTSVGARRRLRTVLLAAFYGRQAEGDKILDRFDLDGFEGEVREMPTRHGVATVYVGRPLGPTAVGHGGRDEPGR